MAIAYKHSFSAMLILAAVVASSSTTALVGLTIAIGYMVVQGRRNMAFAVVSVLTLAIFVNTPLFEEIVVKKVSDLGVNSSRIERETTFWQAWDLFTQAPLTGLEFRIGLSFSRRTTMDAQRQ